MGSNVLSVLCCVCTKDILPDKGVLWMAVEYKTLTFPNNAEGQAEKIKALQWYSSQGWEVVSENITQGKFRGGTAFCLAVLICLPAAFCAGSTDGEITVTLKRDTSRLPSRETAREVITVVATPVVSQSENSAPIAPTVPQLSQQTSVNLSKSNVSESVKKNSYEPVIGIATNALIKRAMLFIEDGEIYEAERYIEQALNQDPENPQVYMAKLMLEHRVKSPVELLNKLSTPLENEKLFQRALRFAVDEYKSQLEGLAQSNRNKLEQARMAREAECERIRLEKEAEKEKLYQKIMAMKSKASTVSEFEEVLRLISSLKPYKDTKELYTEVSEALYKERDYQRALETKRNAHELEDFRSLVYKLEQLNGYKDSELLLTEAREALNKAEQHERRKKIVKVIVVIAIVILFLCYIHRAELAKRREAEDRQRRADEAFRLAINIEANENPPVRAIHYYRQAIELGHPEAQKYLTALENKLAQHEVQIQQQAIQDAYAEAEEYFKAKNYSQAFEKYQILANQGYAPAQHKLGWLYQNGWGTQRDYSQAMQWYSRAAEQGHAGAQSGIGMLYEEGLGVTKDLHEALRWYKISASNGSKSAPEHVSLVERIIFNENTRNTLIANRNDIPIPATIFGNKVNLRISPRIKAKSVKQLNAGHPVSISRLSDENDGMWCFVKTASGSEGWVKSDYLALSSNISRTDQERSNRKYNLPANGVVANILTPGDKLNIRNIPSLNAPKILAQIELGEQVQVLEIFAESERDWYRIRCETMIYLPEEETDYDAEIEGWVNGRYINIR